MKEYEVTAAVREEKLVTYLVRARNQSIAEAMILNQDQSDDYLETSIAISKRVTKKIMTTMERDS